MKENNKSSIIKDALTDYNTIMEAADANAKKKLAEKFPENFNELMNEEINNNKKAKESYKKLDNAKESEKSDETESKKESGMKNQVKETVKVVDTVGKGKPFDNKAKNVEEDVKVTDTVGKSDPFTNKKGAQKIEEEREKDFMGDVEGETPNQAKGETSKGIAFKDKIKSQTIGKPISNLKEEFDISELNMDAVEEALNSADNDDDVITFDDIENEISEMETLGDELPDMGGMPRSNGGEAAGQGGDAYTKLVSMRNELDEMIKNMGGDNETQNESMDLQSDEMSPQEFNQFSPNGIEESFEDDDVITDDDIDSVLGGSPEQNVEEQLGVSHATNRNMTATIPANDYVGQGQLSRRREGIQESKKISSLIEENKKLTKKLNETKKYKQSVTTLVESYKSALEKYRNQLREMAIFNTNLSHVNNLMVNEGLALTQDDKIKIINEFKKVNSIAESQNKYKAFLTEMKGSKKTISESIEHKVSASIQPSSKQKLDEVIEKTAYANDKHIQKMRNLIEYVENRGKKIIK